MKNINIEKIVEIMARPLKNDSKKDKRSVYVTPEAWSELDRIADEFMLSRSDLIEMVGQGRLKIERVELEQPA